MLGSPGATAVRSAYLHVADLAGGELAESVGQVLKIPQPCQPLVLDRGQKGEVESVAMTRFGLAHFGRRGRVHVGVAENGLFAVVEYLGIVGLRRLDDVVDVPLVFDNEGVQAFSLGGVAV